MYIQLNGILDVLEEDILIICQRSHGQRVDGRYGNVDIQREESRRQAFWLISYKGQVRSQMMFNLLFYPHRCPDDFTHTKTKQM